MLQWVILVSCILSVGNRTKFIYRSVSLYMPSSSWHILLIGRELHTCNSKCFFLTLHLAVSTEASAWLSTNDLVLFSTLTSGDAFVFESQDGVGEGDEGEDRKHNADQMNSRWTEIIKCLFEIHRGCTSSVASQIYKNNGLLFLLPGVQTLQHQSET